MKNSETRPDADHRETREFQRLVATYVDRLNAGERIEPIEVVANHPEYGERILEELETFTQMGASPVDAVPLRTLGDYTIRRQIGRGGMGVVYEAWQGSMDRVVALKVLPGAVAADEKAVSRFIREAQAAGRLDHPNVVHVHGMGVEENTPYYSMEYVEGETLAQVLARIEKTESEDDTAFGKKNGVDYFETLAEVFADVADGLQHAHSKGVVHRDIKPSNLILDRGREREADRGGRANRSDHGRLRILDFGLARLEGQESLTMTGDLMGTPLYMSPEQAMARRIPIDHRTDIYSLGATMYESLTGRPPFEGRNHQDTLTRILFEEPRAPQRIQPRVPKDFETIVLKCLRKDSGDRYGTAEALGQDLRRFGRGHPIEARPQSTVELALRRAWRHRWRGVAGLLVLALLITASLLVLASRREDQRRREEAYAPAVHRALRTLRFAQLSGPGASHHELGLLPWRFHLVSPDFSSREGTRSAVEESVRILTEAIDLVPDRLDAYWHRSRAYVLLGDDYAALEDIVQVRRKLELLPAVFLEASLRESHGETALAEELRQAAEANANAWEKSWLDAQRQAKRIDWSRAAEGFAAALGSVSKDEEPYLGWRLEMQLGRGIALSSIRSEPTQHLVEALQEFALVRAEWPDTLELALFEATAWFGLGSEHGPDNPLNAMATTLLEQSPARERYPNTFGVAAAWICRDQGWETMEDWRVTIQDDALRAQVRAMILEGRGKRKEAILALREAVSLDPTNPNRHFRLAYRLYNRNPPFEAVEVIERCLELAPDSPHANFWEATQAACLARIGGNENIDRAAEKLSRIRVSNPDHGATWVSMARASEELGNHERARQDYECAVELAYSAEHYKEFGRFLDRIGDYEAAVEAFDTASEIWPKFSFPHGNRGDVLLKLGDLQGAIESYEAACEGLPRNIGAHAQLGKLLENDYPAEAFTAYVGALEIHPLASSPGDSAYVAHAGLQGLLEQHPAAVFGREITRLIRLLKDAPEGHPNALKQLSTTLDKCRSAVGDPTTDKNGNSDSR